MNSRAIECSEIAPGLYQGSAPEQPGPLLRNAGVDILVLTAEEFQPPSEWFPGVEIVRLPMQDILELPVFRLITARAEAKILARAIKAGRTVLVTCGQGRNRSGLVSALILCELTGCSGTEAIGLIKARRRSPFGNAMTNVHFNEIVSMQPRKMERGPVTQNFAGAVGLR